ncbi:MAG: hypothetical protein ACO1OB_08370 [Archangium sp.]
MTSNTFLLTVMELQSTQRRLAAELNSVVSDARPELLREHLRGLRADVVHHFAAKDSFYETLRALAHQQHDAETERFVEKTAAEMKAQSSRVRRFFGDLDAMGPQVTVTIFRALEQGIQRRFETELQSTFPVAVRTACLSKRA